MSNLQKYLEIVENEKSGSDKVSKLIKEIDSIKSKLKKQKLVENFGQKEIRKLEDKYNDLSDYSENGKKIKNLISSFDDWCSNFDGEK